MSEFYAMTKKVEGVIKRVKKDEPIRGVPERRFIFIKAIQARLAILERETLEKIMEQKRRPPK